MLFCAVRTLFALLVFVACAVTLVSQQPLPFTAVPAFPLNANPLKIERAARPNQPFSVVGQRGAILGQQDGTFELWLLPVKVLHNARLTARLRGYDAPIELNDCASSIEVRPDHTTITYAHAAITVRQHMFIPRTGEPGVASAMVLFEVHAIRAAELTLRFAPSMERQWPAPNYGRPNGGWVARGNGGAFVLETDDPRYFGVIAMPNATPGALRPYQERPKTEPLEIHFTYEPGRDDGVFYPLLAAVSDGKSSGEAARLALLDRLLAQAPRISELYRETASFYQHFFDTHLTVSTPEPSLDRALRWAEIAIEQSQVATAQGSGLAGGWFTSGDSARPGFGWFFGRDTLWTLYAVNSYGDFALSRSAMDFLLAHQRADGKMMHEYSQTAAEVDWEHLPYLYAAADSTPLFVMQMEDYVRSSGDLSYLRQHWDNVKRAYAFTRAHTTDEIYDNTQGTGWVEEWLPRMPHQEIYLAALDQQSAESLARLAHLMQDEALSRSAMATAAAIRTKLAGYRLGDGTYAFSRNADGTNEAVPSIFPAVAWWDGRLTLPEADAMFDGWASHRFATDWGTRSVAPETTGDQIYDPISYHHGSVWPLYTGWAAMAQYRTGRSLQGYANLYNDAQLTWLQDPGAITEVLSGEFLEPLGRSSSHQLWSSAMLLTPAVRGLFGLEPDAVHHALRVAPQLPADWNEAAADNVRVGAALFRVSMTRVRQRLEVDVSSAQPEVLCLRQVVDDVLCAEGAAVHHRVSLALPPVEVSVPHVPALEGARTSALKVISAKATAHGLMLAVEAPSGTEQHLRLRRNDPALRAITAEGAQVEGDDLVLRFGAGAVGVYQPMVVTLHW